MIGSIGHILTWGAKHTRDGIERSFSPSDFREINDRVHIPSWIQTDGESVYLGTESDSMNEYFSIKKSFRRPKLYPVLNKSNSEQSVSLCPDQKFTGLDVQLIDVQHTDTVEISATFTHANGRTTEDSVRYEFQDADLHEGNVLPISFTLSDPAVEATLELCVDSREEGLISTFQLPERLRHHNWKPDRSPRLSVPAPRGQDGFPIFLISVDTLRYDALKLFKPVLEELGDDAVVPDEPRTQGHWTRPAHASMFTGTHPATHGYVGTAGDNEGQYGIHPNLTTVPELLANNLYKCSGCVIGPKTGIEYGFGRGMHQYSYESVSWADPNHDGADSIDQVIQWIDRDNREQSDRLFYFLHLFDPHYPYLPNVFSDISPVDFDILEKFHSMMSPEDYLETLESPNSMPEESLELIKSYYYRSVKYISNHIARLIQYIKQIGLYSDAFLIITGDHGEDFFEREFAGHNSVTDANIRPGMIIKPPANADFKVPNNADIIDFLPTIAELIGESIPDQCQGQAWQNKPSTPRVTERIRPDWYTISVEVDSTKGIYTYQENFPNCPTESQFDEGPTDIRFYDTSSRTSGEPLSKTVPSDSLKREFKQVIEDHIQGQHMTITPDEQVQASAEARERLKQLGYK